MTETFERIIELMKEQKIQDKEMIDYLGMSHGAFSNWRRGKGKSYYEHIDQIADRLGVSVDYLLRGYDVNGITLMPVERELIESFRNLTEEGKDVILRNVRLIQR